MNRLFWSLFTIGLLLAWGGCTDILETDISEDEVVIRLPLDSTTSTQSVQTFWWEELDGADAYRLTVVSPSFDNIQRRALEVVVAADATSYDTTLISGTYQWTLVGENGGYSSQPVIYTLFVESDTSSDLTTKSILLTSPASNTNTNESTIDFRWDPMANALNYTIQVASPDFSDNGNILLNELTEDNNFSATFSEGDYRWRVRGENNTSVSPYSERAFSIDQTAPSAPQLSAPADDAEVTLPVTLSWTPDATSSQDTLYIFSDSLSNNQILKLGTTSTSYSFNDSSFTEYFWRVRSIDAAGNVGGFSGWRKFIVQ